MTDLRQILTFLAIIQTAGSAILFLVVVRYISAPRENASNSSQWLVLSRGNSYHALRVSDAEWSEKMGFLFAVFFYYAFPLWWWLWGWKRSAILISLTVISAIVVSKLIIAPMLQTIDESGEMDGDLFLSISLIILARVTAGFYIRKHYNSFRRQAYEMRGWQLEGTIEASSASAAIQLFTGRPSVSWLQVCYNKLRRRTN